MHKNIGKDIYETNLEYTYLSLMSQKLRVGIIGGGKTGYLKGKSFASKGCIVEVLSLNFIEEFYKLENVKLTKGGYKEGFLKDKHLIIIATDNYNKNLEIKRDCEKMFKLYIFTSDYSQGIVTSPAQGELKNIVFSVNTREGNPKGIIMLKNKIFNALQDYDDFIGYSSALRNNAKSIKDRKKEIIEFICSEDFKYIYEKKKDKIIMKLFFDEKVVKELYKNL